MRSDACSASAMVSYVPTRTITQYLPVDVLCTCLGNPVLFLAFVLRWFPDQVSNLKLLNRLFILFLSSWSTHMPTGGSVRLCIFHMTRWVRNLPYPGMLVLRYLQVALALSSAKIPTAPRAFFFHNRRPSGLYVNHSSNTSTGGSCRLGTGICNSLPIYARS